MCKIKKWYKWYWWVHCSIILSNKRCHSWHQISSTMCMLNAKNILTIGRKILSVLLSLSPRFSPSSGKILLSYRKSKQTNTRTKIFKYRLFFKIFGLAWTKKNGPGQIFSGDKSLFFLCSSDVRSGMMKIFLTLQFCG